MMYVKVMKINIDLLKLFISFKTILWDVAQNAWERITCWFLYQQKVIFDKTYWKICNSYKVKNADYDFSPAYVSNSKV